MEKLEKTESWTPNAIDPTAAGLADPDRLPDRARDRLRPRQGGREEGRLRAPAQHLLPRGRLGDRLRAAERTGRRHRRRRLQKGRLEHQLHLQLGLRRLRAHRLRALRRLSRSGPRAPRRTSRSSAPASTTGRASSPRPRLADYLPFAKHPQAVDPDYLVSWNNKQAPEWAAADDKYDYGPLQRSQMIADRVQGGDQGQEEDDDRPAGPGDGGTGDRGPARLPAAADDLQGDRQAEVGASCKSALATLRAWHKAGAHRRDLNRDGVDEETPAIELMDAWWPKLVEAEFKPALGEKAFERLEGMLRIGDHTAARPTPRTSTTAGGATSPRTCATSSGRSRRGACSRELLRRRLEGEVPGAAAADADGGAEGDAGAALRRRQRRLRRQPAALLLRPEPAAGDRRASNSAPSRSRTGRPSSRS